MKSALKNIPAIAIILTAISFSGCAEPHYYHTYNHHTREWYGRRHVPPPAGINFEIDVRTGHRRHYRH